MQRVKQKRRRRLEVKIEYACLSCGKTPPDDYMKMVCPCGGAIRGKGPGISGTRDNFGISKIFRDENSGQEIDTWKKWEKAGYQNPLETVRHPKVRENVKKKIKTIKNS